MNFKVMKSIKKKLEKKIKKYQSKIDSLEKVIELLSEDTFVLPEKWCVKDCDKVSKWASKKFGCSSVLLGNKFLHVQFLNTTNQNYLFHDMIKEGYTEITFEQFKKYVLNECN